MSEFWIRDDEDSCVPAVLCEGKYRERLVPCQASDSVSVCQISSIEKFLRRNEVREDDVTSQIESDRVSADKAAVLDIVDFNPPKITRNVKRTFYLSPNLLSGNRKL